MFSCVAVLVLALATVDICVAHMILENPKPYGSDTLNNSPLDSLGRDFPCKQREGVYDLSQMNYWAVGEVQTVSFQGSAVHGGGSCQFSVTTDREPTKASRWKVIHSVIGGCPASTEGNFADDPMGRKAGKFDIVLPEGMPSGLYTLAWTWFNREGAREMYMNCAPISVSGGSKNSTFLTSLPDMFVANLPNTECATVEKFDYAFPQPGDSVTTGSSAKVITTLDGTGCVTMTRMGAGSGTLPSIEAVAQGPSKQSGMKAFEGEMPAQVTTDSALATRKALAGVFEATLVTDIVVPATMVSSITASGTADAAQSQTHNEAVIEPFVSSSTCVPCTEGGNVVCFDEQHFGLCDRGCTVPQPLAAGTFCSHGSIIRRSVRGYLNR
jgi:hypothetical protein